MTQARTGPMPTTGRWGWYRDHEGNEYRRVSTLVKKVETDTYNLDRWKLRQVAEGLALRDDLVLAVKAMGRPGPDGWAPEDKKKIDGVVKDASSAAKQRDGARTGTAMHDLTERVDRGEQIDIAVNGLPAGAAQTLRAYHFLRTQNAWRSVEIERTVVCDPLEVAGTFDRVDLVPGLAKLLGPGTCQYGHLEGDHWAIGLEELPVVVDVKTEAAPWLNGLHIGPQLAIYSRSRKMWHRLPGEHQLYGSDGKPKLYPSGDPIMIPNGEYVPAPCVRQDVAVVVHLYESKATPLFVNLAEGWEAAVAAYEQANRETRAGRKLGTAGAWFAPVPGIVEPAPAQMLTEQAAFARYADPARPAADGTPYAVGDTVTVGGVEFTKHSEVPAVVEQVAVTGPDGLVRFQPVSQVAASLNAAERRFDERDELRIKLVRAIAGAETRERLAELWTMAQAKGVPWTNEVEAAGAARAAIVGCVQRQLHVGGPEVRCACGWTGEDLP